MSTNGDELLTLLGERLDNPAVIEALERIDVPWRPEVSPSKPLDWISTGNLELGFSDFVWFHALDTVPSNVAPVLQQICFYAPGANTARIFAPAYFIQFGWDRMAVRRHLAPRAQAMRFGRRDVFEVGPRTISITYNEQSSCIDSVLVLAALETRPTKAQPPIGFSELSQYFGRPWYDAQLQSRLYALSGSDAELGQIEKHGTYNLMREAAVRLLFHRAEPTCVLSGCDIYRDRVRDACSWSGDLPYGLAFHDTPHDVAGKLRHDPEREIPGDLESIVCWSMRELHLLVTFDLIVNLISSISVRISPSGPRL